MKGGWAVSGFIGWSRYGYGRVWLWPWSRRVMFEQTTMVDDMPVALSAS